MHTFPDSAFSILSSRSLEARTHGACTALVGPDKLTLNHSCSIGALTKLNLGNNVRVVDHETTVVANTVLHVWLCTFFIGTGSLGRRESSGFGSGSSCSSCLTDQRRRSIFDRNSIPERIRLLGFRSRRHCDETTTTISRTTTATPPLHPAPPICEKRSKQFMARR